MNSIVPTSACAAVLLLAAPCIAQSAAPVQAPAGYAPLTAPCSVQPDGGCASVDPAHPFPIDGMVHTAAVNRGASVGTTAVTLMPANAARRGYAVQVQSASASCYINGSGTATADYNSLQIGPGGYFQPDHHVGTGAISIVCSAANVAVYAREW